VVISITQFLQKRQDVLRNGVGLTTIAVLACCRIWLWPTVRWLPRSRCPDLPRAAVRFVPVVAKPWMQPGRVLVGAQLCAGRRELLQRVVD